MSLLSQLSKKEEPKSIPLRVRVPAEIVLELDQLVVYFATQRDSVVTRSDLVRAAITHLLADVKAEMPNGVLPTSASEGGQGEGAKE